jgi:hypothetical protein
MVSVDTKQGDFDQEVVQLYIRDLVVGNTSRKRT